MQWVLVRVRGKEGDSVRKLKVEEHKRRFFPPCF